MDLCNNEHIQVCFEGRSCPVCDKMAEIDDLEDQIADLNSELRNALQKAKSDED